MNRLDHQLCIGRESVSFCHSHFNSTLNDISVIRGATDALEHILSHDECDVDPINHIEKATPLHLAMKIEDPELRLHIVNSLLEAGADITCVAHPIVALLIGI